MASLGQAAQDFFDGAVRAPLSVFRMPRRTALFLLLYLLLGGAVLGAVAGLVMIGEDDLRRLLLDYLFPSSWHFAADLVIDRVLAAQHRAVIANAVVAGSLGLVSLLLFRVKELVSASFERERKLVEQPMDEFPLWFQAWEEMKYLLLYVAVQATIFWIGYRPEAWRKSLAVGFSTIFLFYSFATDFISPIFQRHRGRYSRILKTLAMRPLASLSFGAVFSLPPLAAGWLWQACPGCSLVRAIPILFAANLLSMISAAVAGTWLGARLFSTFAKTRASHRAVRLAAWLALLAALAWNGYVFGSLGRAAHFKSQILKCNYSLVPGSFSLQRPQLLALLGGNVEFGVSFSVNINNPTPHRVRLEENRLEIKHEGTPVATARLSRLDIAPGASVADEVRLTVSFAAGALGEGLKVLDPRRWTVTLYLEIAPGLEFPFYLTGP